MNHITTIDRVHDATDRRSTARRHAPAYLRGLPTSRWQAAMAPRAPHHLVT